MRGLYVCAFEVERTLSYLSDWRDTFANRGFDVLNAATAGWGRLAEVAAGFPRYDVIVFGYSCYYGLAGARRSLLARLCRMCRSTVVGFMQNEFRNFQDKTDFLTSLHVDVLVSQVPQGVADEFYAGRTRAKILSVPHGLYTGTPVDRLAHAERPIDVGSRLYEYAVYLGNVGRAETIPALLNRLRADTALVIDWETDASARFGRDEWLGFLARCRLTLAAEAGTFYMQWCESKRAAVNERLKREPGTPFRVLLEEILERDAIHLSAAVVSPRHFDAIHAGACQVLTSGRYSDTLQAGQHYIELKLDGSNTDEVIEQMKDIELCSEVAERARAHALGLHTLEHRVDALLAAL